MSKNKKKIKKRNKILTYLMSNDPSRLRERVVPAKKGKGRANKPRRNNWSSEADSRLGVDLCCVM